jgi:Na+/proline symporter
MASSFHPIDWLIIAAYLLSMAGVGVYFSRRQTSLDRFMLADRTMGWLPVGLSLMAALNSGMDYLMQPSSTIRFGFVLVLGTLSWLALYPWVAKVVFPFYHRLKFFSVYEYLEARFDVRVRTLAAVIFILWRLGWMATAMYVPSLAVNAASGGAVDLNTMTIVVGVLVTAYTTLGGIQAVIWNDVVQFCIMFGGLGATVGIVWSSVPGGFREIITVASSAGKMNFWPALVDPAATGVVAQVQSFFEQPMTVVALLVALVVGRMAQYTSDQVMVQRLQTTVSLKEARQGVIYAYFQHHTLPPEFQTDKLVPYFMSLAFPAGAVGLVIAAIMAASLSSIDSAINSCSSVAVVDLYNRVWQGKDTGQREQSAADDRAQVLASRVATVFFGASGTVLACNVSRIGSLLEINNKVVNAFTGPMLGIFVLAMFSERATSAAALAGGVAGALAAYVVAYHTSIGFLWPSTFGLGATLLVGFAFAFARPAALAAKGRGLTWHRVMARN